MSSAGNKNFFATNLLQLQNFIKRDPTSYKDEVYLMKPSKPNKQLSDLALFLAHVSHCFADELKAFPQQMIDLLKKYSTVLNPDMRMSFCRCLILIRNKKLIEPVALFQTFFSLIKCQDKALRKFLYEHMLNDIKRIKTKLRDHKLCSKVQQYVFTLSKDQHPQVSKYAMSLLVDLYKKKIWNDTKTVNVIAAGCFTKMPKVISLVLQFFAGKDVEEEENESDSDKEEKQTEQQVLLGLRVGKKTKKREKRSNRALKTLRRDKKKKNKGDGLPHFSALNLIYDPQDFAEKLFKLVEGTNEGFELKLAILELIARLIGVHGLFLLNFHPYLLRFLNPHQREVTKMLWFAAISSHELTPPDTVEPVLMGIANNFISERNNSEVIAVGLNAVREICGRCPLAMSEELLGDLIEYKTYKDKAVSSAAKSLVQLFREKNPEMLHKRMRGKPTEASVEEAGRVRRYGEVESRNYVPGAEVIESEKEEEGDKEIEKEGDEEEWEECSDDEVNEKEGGKVNNKKRKHSEDDEDEEEEEGDDDDEWVDVSNDEEVEEGAEAKVETKLSLEEKEKRASKISSEKIFSQEDFKRIKMEQMKKKLSDKGFVKNKKKTISVETDSENEEDAKAARDGLVPLTSIIYVNSKKRRDKESRLESVKKGRDEREKFGHRFKESHLGKTNNEKLKSKPFMMVRHKIQKKFRRSFKDKQEALRSSLLKQKKMK